MTVKMFEQGWGSVELIRGKSILRGKSVVFLRARTGKKVWSKMKLFFENLLRTNQFRISQASRLQGGRQRRSANCEMFKRIRGFKARRRTASILEKVNYLVTVNIVVSLLYFTFEHRIYRLSPHTIQTPSRDRCISAELNFGLESRAFGNRLPRFWLKNGSSSHITGMQNLSLTKCLPGVTLLFRNCAGILKGADWDCATLGKRCF